MSGKRTVLEGELCFSIERNGKPFGLDGEKFVATTKKGLLSRFADEVSDKRIILGDESILSKEIGGRSLGLDEETVFSTKISPFWFCLVAPPKVQMKKLHLSNNK